MSTRLILVLVILPIAGVVYLIQKPTSSPTDRDVHISDYAINFQLGKDVQNHSILQTTEYITAHFPQRDQNHGLERSIPQSYQYRRTNLTIQSVTDELGRRIPYTTYTSGDNLVVRMGNKNLYVHGANTYVIRYAQSDVINYAEKLKRDEFYWNTNGTGWRVPIDKLRVRLAVDPSIQTAATGDIACYQGKKGSKDRCDLEHDNGVYSVEAQNLKRGENVTIAVGFRQGTFVTYKLSLLQKLIPIVIRGWIVSIPLIIIAAIVMIVRYRRWDTRSSERHVVVAEYLPPKDTSVTTAAALLGGSRSIFTAQLLDFAVRHYVKIIETRPKSFWHKAEYDIEIIKDITTLKEEEQEILKDIFGSTEVGQRLALKSLQNNTTVYNRMVSNDKKLKALMRGQYGLTAKDEAKSAWFKKLSLVLLVLAVVLFNPAILVLSIGAIIASHKLWPLTDKGLELARYLDGLKQYIKVAEVDRLKMLQSPEGAQKTGKVNIKDSGQLVKLYEEVLPYASMFGLEKQWNQRIGQYYEALGKSPDWYTGATNFSAAGFSNSMGGFSAAAGYSSASSSSSSGGSSGGGSSGGGGGGGGGGGW